ncbi:MAG: hypothetical protein PVG39_01660 [Desulfobacteraceae bacterium]|jgi:hypothetical protein
MGLLTSGYKKYLFILILFLIIFQIFYSCERPGGSHSDVKLTVLDPRGQPTGIFGRRGAAGAHMLANRNPDTQPKISRDELVLMRMAPRLDTVNGKTIYLVDTGFAGGKEFFEELEKWFKKNMPAVNIVVKPKPGNAFADSPEFWVELKQKADGVIFGVAGCDGCSASLAEFSRTMESEFGVPTAPMVTARFAEYVIRDGHTHGMNLRWSFPPYPVIGVSKEKLVEYINGNDPVSGVKLTDEIISALTKPLTEAELNPVFPKKKKWPRLLKPDTEANLQRLFLENGWTDGLPIVMPTEERVAEMLTGTGHDPQEVVGMMSVTTHEEQNEYTVEKVAAIAVMAGARPEHLPVILAIASTQHPSIPSSTGSYGSMVVVNGPVAKIIGMNSGGGALGPFNYANSVIGRAWTLMSIVFGDARPGDTYMASIGNGISYNNQCCAENEVKSPWESFHVRNGFKASDSTVSVFRGWNVQTLGMGGAEALLQRIQSSGMMGACTFVVDPLAAKSLKDEGWDDPGKLSEYLARNLGNSFFKPRPEGINFIVVGGETNPVWQSSDYTYYKTVSVDKWMPEGGIRLDEKPLRMPVSKVCDDELCLIGTGGH